MKNPKTILTATLFCALLGWGLSSFTQQGAAPPPGGAVRPTISPDADEILRKMSTYMDGLKAFSVSATIENEVITTEGQKLQMCSSSTILMKKPGSFRLTRQGMFADTEITYDGKLVTILGKRLGCYIQYAETGTTDEAIRHIEMGTGLDAPGADLFLSSPYTVLTSGAVKGEYIGTDFVNGVECDHLAFRKDKVDWQLWVQTGDRPLPMKYVITTKWFTGAPQYGITLRDWDTVPKIAADAFHFTAPQGARKLDSLPVNEMGEISLPEEGR